jgi:uncharacterized repeat protein (TIGR04138 family)
MRLCDVCKEPAARQVTTQRNGVATTADYCYVHAIKAGLLEFPLDQLERVSAETGYPVNGLIFVLESLTRTGCIRDRDATYRNDDIAPKTALELCVFISKAAIERFQQQAGLALGHWKLMTGKDLGAVCSGLVQSGVLMTASTREQDLLQDLSGVDGPLLVDCASVRSP